MRSGEAAEQMRRCCARSRPRVCVCACVCVAFGCVRYIFLILLLFGYCAVLRAVLRVVLRVIGCVAVGRSALCASGFRCVVDCVVGCVVLRVVGCVAVSVRRARRLQGTVKADGRGRVERLRGSDFRGHVRRPGPPRPPRSPPRLPVFSGSAACGIILAFNRLRRRVSVRVQRFAAVRRRSDVQRFGGLRRRDVQRFGGSVSVRVRFGG